MEVDPDHEPMRIVKPLVISPSADIAVIAKTLEQRMPKSVRYLMEGLGTPDARSADLTSFLLFDSAFTRELIELGYRDASLRIDEIEAFLCDDDFVANPSYNQFNWTALVTAWVRVLQLSFFRILLTP